MLHLQDNFGDHFNAFDYAQTFGGHAQSAFGQHPSAVQQHQQQQHQDQQQQAQAQSPSTNGSVNGSSSSMRGDGGSGSGSKADANLDERGSDDDDIMTPAQSRRKAQNRAA